MRTRARLGGLAAVVGAATLAVPLLAIAPAQAAPAADLSITKTVSDASSGTIVDQSQFIASIADMRGGGGYQFTDDGLSIRTTGTGDKAAQYWPQSGPIPSTASIAWTQDQGIFMPGMQIVFDADGILGNGIGDWNILVNVPSDNGSNWWLTPSSSTIAKTAAPSCNNPAPTCVGLVNGYPWYGHLAAWSGALSAAKIYAVGFSIGSGASGTNSGVISSMDYGSQHYTFGGFSSSVKAAPGSTVEYKLTVANSGSAAAANSVVVTDTLPFDLTPLSATLIDNGNGCAFSGQNLTCNAGTFPPGTSTVIKFKATISNTVSSAGLPSTIGHNVDVQKQEVFADLPAGQTRTYAAYCPAGYVPTDGGLLIDAVDQGGFYSDIVISRSTQTTQSGIRGWTVTATNLGDERGQGKVKVTCLDGTIGSADGHTHDVVVTPATLVANPLIVPAPTPGGQSGTTIEGACPTGYTPIAPRYDVTNGIVVVRTSWATGSSWFWTVDHESGASATFDVSCLAPETTSSGGHTASLGLSTRYDTVSIGADSRGEGVAQCPSLSNAIVGGYGGYDASVLSLGKEPRGNNYMFRFHNEDWDRAWNADIQVTCVGVRTPDEPTYYHVVNTATVTNETADANTGDNSSSADISIVGDPVAPASGVAVAGTGTRTRQGGQTRYVNLTITCTSACSFTVKVLSGGDVVAKATKSLPGSATPKSVSVPTTSAGRDLGNGPVSVKVKTTSGTSTTPVTLQGVV